MFNRQRPRKAFGKKRGFKRSSRPRPGRGGYRS